MNPIKQNKFDTDPDKMKSYLYNSYKYNQWTYSKNHQQSVKQRAPGLFIFVLMMVFFSLFFAGDSAWAAETPAISPAASSDELLRLKEEIRQLKLILNGLIQTLPEEQKLKFTEMLKVLDKSIAEKEVSKDSQETSYTSAPSKGLDGIKQTIENIRTEVKDLTGGFLFSGFFDVKASMYKNNPRVFSMGNFELNIEKAIGKNIRIFSTLVFNTDAVEMTVGYIDFHLFGGKVQSREKMFVPKGIELHIGRFDIPFGNDWKYFPVPFRKSISAPMTTDIMMNGGYNDIGIQIVRSAVRYNLSLYVLRGLTEGITYGGRFHLTPLDTINTLKDGELSLLEFGMSYFANIDRSGEKEQNAFALDCESNLGPLHFQGELFTKHSYDENRCRKGGHISSSYNLKLIRGLPMGFFGRYDFFHEEPMMDWDKNRAKSDRMTLGCNFNIHDVAILKFEYAHFFRLNLMDAGGSKNSVMMQLVIIL